MALPSDRPKPCWHFFGGQTLGKCRNSIWSVSTGLLLGLLGRMYKWCKGTEYYSAIKRNKHLIHTEQAWISTPSSGVEEPRHRLTVWLYFCDSLQKAKTTGTENRSVIVCLGWRKGAWLQNRHQRIFGVMQIFSFFIVVGYTTVYICSNSSSHILKNG